MKKLILLALVAVIMAGCGGAHYKDDYKDDDSVVLDRFYKEHTIVIDSCEYFRFVYEMSHKGNCRFCKERREKELKELVKQIKGE